jgi:thioredoxin 1
MHVMTDATDASFEADVLRAPGPVLVDFWAGWCCPSRPIAPLLEEISKEVPNRVTVVSFDVDRNPLTPVKYAVTGVPTLILFKGGQVAARKLGVVTKDALLSWLQTVVA